MIGTSRTIATRAALVELIPDLSGGGAGCKKTHNDFIPPASGPGPVTWEPAHHYYGNGEDHPPTARIHGANGRI